MGKLIVLQKFGSAAWLSPNNMEIKALSYGLSPATKGTEES